MTPTDTTHHHPAPPADPDSSPLIDAQAADDLPTSFGVFKPVGHLMLGLPTQAQVDALVPALRAAGWAEAAVRQFTPRESLAELQAMVDKAGPLAGFGYGIVPLKRYVAMTEAGCRWLLVQVDDTDHARRAADLAQAGGATLAVHYRLLTTEELIP